MTITRVGATKRYSDNWEEIFGGGTKKAAGNSATSVTKSGRIAAKKKSAKKKSAKSPAVTKTAKKASRRK
jgi:hypothetical protein